MNITMIVSLIILILLYIGICIFLSYYFGEEDPLWLQILTFPFDVLGFILLFPFVIYEKHKLKEEYTQTINHYKYKKN